MANTFKNSVTGSIGSSGTVVYTTPTNAVSTVIGISVSNTIADNIYVDVKVVDSSSSNFEAFLIKGALVLPSSNIVLVGGEQKVVLESDDYISISTDKENCADVIVSVLEIS